MDICGSCGSDRTDLRGKANVGGRRNYILLRTTWHKQSIFPLYIAYTLVQFLVGTASLLFSFVHYVYIFRKLHIIKNSRVYSSSASSSMACNVEDIPIEWKSELRVLNSMACLSIMMAVPMHYQFSV